MRATFGVAALELGNSIERLMILTGDVSTSAGLDRFKKKLPESPPNQIASFSLIPAHL
mgnify:CR=1 FL=1